MTEYVLQRLGPMSATKLEKRVYYCQAWSLALGRRPLFPERVEAWRDGPVVPLLFQRHRGRFVVTAGEVGGDAATLDPKARSTVEAVIDGYGAFGAEELSTMAHEEEPWRAARRGLSDREVSHQEVTQASMALHYAQLVPTPVGGSSKFYLRSLLSKVTPENLHGEVSTGVTVGRENW